MICAYSLGLEICVFTFRMDFELRGWPPQPPTFSSTVKLGFKGRQDKRKLDFKRQIPSDQLFM